MKTPLTFTFLLLVANFPLNSDGKSSKLVRERLEGLSKYQYVSPNIRHFQTFLPILPSISKRLKKCIETI